MALEKNSIIQVDPGLDNIGWGGCLCVVDEVKPWGVQAFIEMPRYGGRAYVQLNHGTFKDLGVKAEWVVPEGADQG